ncbi:hypothetical protein BJX65DRAFT_301210 [Aspergillus insuetus]
MRAGPGGSGWKCHTNVGDMHNRVSSMQWWSDNPSHTTRCCIYLYTGKNCTNCYKIDPGYARRSIDAGEGDEDDDFDPALYPGLYQLADEFGEDFDPKVDEGVETEAEHEIIPL